MPESNTPLSSFDFEAAAKAFVVPDDDSAASRRTRSYLHTYPLLLKRFGELNTPDDLLFAAMATYAWMGRVLIVDGPVTTETLEAFLRAREAEEPSGADLGHLVGVFNNSIVGVSKMLHFAAPQQHAIWDSKVCHVLHGKSYYHFVNQLDRYRTYERDLRTRVANANFEAVRLCVNEKLNGSANRYGGYEVAISPLRAAELLLFTRANASS